MYDMKSIYRHRGFGIVNPIYSKKGGKELSSFK
jgi:hypothetical protein